MTSEAVTTVVVATVVVAVVVVAAVATAVAETGSNYFLVAAAVGAIASFVQNRGGACPDPSGFLLTSTRAQDAVLAEGACPLPKKLDFQPNKILDQEYFLLYGDAAGIEGSYCQMVKLTPFGDGKNESLLIYNTGQKFDLHEIDDSQYPEPRKDFAGFKDDSTVLMFTEDDKGAGVNNQGYVFPPQYLNIDVTEEDMDALFKWEVLDADEDVLVLYSCRQEDTEINGDGLYRWQVEEEVDRLKEIERLVFEGPATVFSIRDGLGTEPQFQEVVRQLNKDDADTIQALIRAVRTLKDGKHSDELESFLIFDEEQWVDIVNLFKMDFQQLDMLVWEREQQRPGFEAEMDNNLYEEILSQEFVKESMHDMILNVHVKDLSKYESDEAFEALKDRVFGLFDSIDREKVEARMGRYRHDRDVCTHYEDGVSIMDLPGTMTIDELSALFMQGYAEYENEGMREDL